MGGRHLPEPADLGDLSYYIQRGATLQNYRILAHQAASAPTPVTVAVDTIVAIPFPIGLGCRLDRIGFNCTTLAAGSSARVGLYRAISPKNIYPGARVVDSGALATTSTGWKEANINTPLSPGLYWACYLAGVLAPAVSGLVVGGTGPANPILGWTAANPPVPNARIQVAFAFAAFPATFPGGAAYSALAMPQVQARVAA